MFQVDAKRAAIVEAHFYSWKTLMFLSVLFTGLSISMPVANWLQILFQIVGVGAMFLTGGRWMFDRTISSVDLPVELEADFQNQYRIHLEGLDGNARKAIKEILDQIEL